MNWPTTNLLPIFVFYYCKRTNVKVFFGVGKKHKYVLLSWYRFSYCRLLHTETGATLFVPRARGSCPSILWPGFVVYLLASGVRLVVAMEALVVGLPQSVASRLWAEILSRVGRLAAVEGFHPSRICFWLICPVMFCNLVNSIY